MKQINRDTTYVHETYQHMRQKYRNHKKKEISLVCLSNIINLDLFYKTKKIIYFRAKIFSNTTQKKNFSIKKFSFSCELIILSTSVGQWLEVLKLSPDLLPL